MCSHVTGLRAKLSKTRTGKFYMAGVTGCYILKISCVAALHINSLIDEFISRSTV